MRRAFAVLAILFLLVLLFPFRQLVSPAWDISVENSSGFAAPGVSVRLVFRDYSIEQRSHELLTITNSNGQAHFPVQVRRTALLQRVYGALRTLGSEGVHASFGPHAYVLAFANGTSSLPISDGSVIDWTGGPDHMQSRLILRDEK